MQGERYLHANITDEFVNPATSGQLSRACPPDDEYESPEVLHMAAASLYRLRPERTCDALGELRMSA